MATTVWFMTYWICRWFMVSERFSDIIASSNARWILFITWILWSGTFFTPAILAD
ncbi:MAG: hypothetical protein JSU83_13335 [Deltaproteobacteria bacterium]|nr:MAG: hypothetical protein JSU83_13335 [Deltaproteobacteria bacterium]